VCANRVVEKFTGLVSKNLGWGDAADTESKSKAVMPLTSVLQAADTQLENGPDGDGQLTESGPMDSALRARCAKIIGKVAGVASLSSELARLFEQYETIADDFETTRFALQETRGRLGEESDAHAILKNRFAAIERELVLERSETAALRGQIDQLAARGSELEQQVHTLQSELERGRGIIQQSDTQAAARLAEIASLGEQLHTATQDVLKAEIAAVAVRAELSSALAHAANVEAANSALQVALSDSRHGMEQLAESLDEARHELQRSQMRLRELEHENETEAGARDGMLSQVEDQRAEMAALNINLAVLSARLEAADRLLKDVPALMERAAAWEQKVIALEAENSEMRAQAAEFEEVQQAVAERAHALVDAFRAKEKESSQTKASLVALSTQLESETKGFEADRARLEAVIADLTQQLNAERERLKPSPQAEIHLANGKAATAGPADDSAAGAEKQEPGRVGEVGRPDSKLPPQKFTLEDHPKPNPGGGRKRRPRHRESNRHISRH